MSGIDALNHKRTLAERMGMFSSAALNKDLGILIIRAVSGGLMAYLHGLPKLQSFSDSMEGFPDPFGIGSSLSLAFVVFAELFCAILFALGIATRAVSIPLILVMAVAAFIHHGPDPLADKELALIYLFCYITVLLTGSGKYSLNRVSFR